MTEHITNKPGGNYVPVIIHDGLAYVSGQLPRKGETLLYSGKVGMDIDLPCRPTGLLLFVQTSVLRQ